MCRVMAGVWRSEANLLESVLSSHQVGLGYWTRVLGLHGRHLDTLSYPASPISSFLLHFLKVILRFIVFMCMRVLSARMSVYHVPGALGDQKRESDPLTLESQMVVNRRCQCWESNSGPPQVYPVLLTTEPSLCIGSITANRMRHSLQIHLPTGWRASWLLLSLVIYK